MAAPARFFDKLREAFFVARPNRFIVECELDGRMTAAYLPNPGRLTELLFPGTRLLLAPSGHGRMRHTVVAAERDARFVMLHTHVTNHVARRLLEEEKVPGLEGYRIERAEVPFGRSRFDFLLRKGRKQFVLEVKSCTLFGRRGAMFPDAVTERGRRHLLELAELRNEGFGSGVLFVVQWPQADCFMPDYHTDLAFARTLCSLRSRLLINALAVSWTDELALESDVKSLAIPWELVEREAHDRGDYLLLLHLPEDLTITVGRLGERFFRKGYYLYAGSAMAHLSKRIERHRRKRKKLFWHIDYLRQKSGFVTAFPVRSSIQLECSLAASLEALADWTVPGFGSSDCRCSSHLFGMSRNPLLSKEFVSMLLTYRIDRVREQAMSVMSAGFDTRGEG